MNNSSNNQPQIYEQYWKYTAAWTNIFGGNFYNALGACVKFFVRHGVEKAYSTKEYKALQKAIAQSFNIDLESVRKAINQFVKLGLLKPYMKGLYPEALEFIKAKDDVKKKTIALSKAVYKHANFQNSMTETNDSWNGHVGFLIKTLEACKTLTKNDIIAVMTYDYASKEKEFLTRNDLSHLYNMAVSSGFTERKYNQVDHLMNLLGKLDNLHKTKGVICFESDAKALFGDEDEQKSMSKYRDPYLQREYKKELIAECSGKCMVENLDYPVLIASHIRPYKDCRDKNDWDAAFDVNNGLLLSKNLDSLFDLGYITFSAEGKIISSDVLSIELRNKLSTLKLNPIYIKPERVKYIKIHQKLVFNKRFKKL